jgi:hypothetical protein
LTSPTVRCFARKEIIRDDFTDHVYSASPFTLPLGSAAR